MRLRTWVFVAVAGLSVTAAEASAQCKEPKYEGGCCACLLGIEVGDVDNRWTACESSGCLCFGSGTPCGSGLSEIAPDGSLHPLITSLADEGSEEAAIESNVYLTWVGSPGEQALRIREEEMTPIRRECDAAIIARNVQSSAAADLRGQTESLIV